MLKVILLAYRCPVLVVLSTNMCEIIFNLDSHLRKSQAIRIQCKVLLILRQGCYPAGSFSFTIKMGTTKIGKKRRIAYDGTDDEFPEQKAY